MNTFTDSIATLGTFVSQGILAVGPLGTKGWVGSLLIGLIVGLLAKAVTPGREPSGCIITVLIGIAGSYLALFAGRMLGVYPGGEVPGFIGSFVGAVVLLLIYHWIFKPGSRL